MKTWYNTSTLMHSFDGVIPDSYTDLLLERDSYDYGWKLCYSLRFKHPLLKSWITHFDIDKGSDSPETIVQGVARSLLWTTLSEILYTDTYSTEKISLLCEWKKLLGPEVYDNVVCSCIDSFKKDKMKEKKDNGIFLKELGVWKDLTVTYTDPNPSWEEVKNGLHLTMKNDDMVDASYNIIQDSSGNVVALEKAQEIPSGKENQKQMAVSLAIHLTRLVEHWNGHKINTGWHLEIPVWKMGEFGQNTIFEPPTSYKGDPSKNKEKTHHIETWQVYVKRTWKGNKLP